MGLSFLVMMDIRLGLSRLDRWKLTQVFSILNYLIHLRTSVCDGILLTHGRLVTIIVTGVCCEASRFGTLGNLRLQWTNITGLWLFWKAERMWRRWVWVRRKRNMWWLSMLLSWHHQCLIPRVNLGIMFIFNEGVQRIPGYFIDFPLILLQWILLRNILLIPEGRTMRYFIVFIFLRVDSEPCFWVWNFIRFQRISYIRIALVKICRQLIIKLLWENLLLRFFILKVVAVNIVLGWRTIVPFSVVFRGACSSDGVLFLVDYLICHWDGSHYPLLEITDIGINEIISSFWFTHLGLTFWFLWLGNFWFSSTKHGFCLLKGFYLGILTILFAVAST